MGMEWFRNAKAIDAILKVKSNMDSGMFWNSKDNCCAEVQILV
jgi:hypothetical protein